MQLNPSGERTAAVPLRAAQPLRGAHSSGTTACSSTPKGSAQQRHHCVQLNPSGELTAAAPLLAAQPRKGARSSGTTACSSTRKGSAQRRHHCVTLQGSAQQRHGANAEVSAHFCICNSTMLNMDCSKAMFGLLPPSGSGGGSGPLPRVRPKCPCG